MTKARETVKATMMITATTMTKLMMTTVTEVEDAQEYVNERSKVTNKIASWCLKFYIKLMTINLIDLIDVNGVQKNDIGIYVYQTCTPCSFFFSTRYMYMRIT